MSNRIFGSGLILVAALTFGTRVHAQGDFPFPDSAALWVQTYSFMVSTGPPAQFEVQAVANIQVNGLDTLMNGVLYSRMTDAVTHAYYGSVRDENGRVWFVPPDSTNEYTLFDLSASSGDTIYDVIYYQAFPAIWSGPELVDVVVLGVEQDPLWGGRLVMQTTWGEWIEGIGHRQGLLAEPDINVSGYQLRLECMSHMDTVRFRYYGAPPFEEPWTCSTIGLHIPEKVDASRTFSIHPNPSTGSLILRSTPAITAGSYYTVHDATGRIIYHKSLPVGADSVHIDLSGYAGGTYVVKLGDQEGVHHARVVLQ
jgi:hypothetical protein